jgi:hypothetical protein
MKKITIAGIIAALFYTSSVFASEVYIEQAGTGVTVNVTQTGSGHIVGKAIGSTDVSVIDGNSITVDVVQNGSTNLANIQLLNASDSTALTYNAQGDTNTVNVSVNGGTGNDFTINKTGDNNLVNICATVVSNECATGIAVNDTVNTIAVTGSRNTVNMALASANSVNTIDIGQNGISNDNMVSITQTNSAPNTITLSTDGDNNTITIIQQ